MNYGNMERDLGAALHAGIGSQSVKQTAPSALSEASDTLNDANHIATRVMDLADRLCGPVPTAGAQGSPEAPPSGDLGRFRAHMRDTRQSFVFADEALSRIERELIG